MAFCVKNEAGEIVAMLNEDGLRGAIERGLLEAGDIIEVKEQ